MYREYIDILNGKLHLSHRESDVLAVLFKVNAEWGTMVKEMGDIMSTNVRKILMRETLITKTNLARYITALRNKGVLITDSKGNLVLNDMFVPDIKDNVCEAKFVLEIE